MTKLNCNPKNVLWGNWLNKDTRNEYKVQGTRYKVQGTRYKVQDTRYKAQGTRNKEQGTRNKVQGSLYAKISTRVFYFSGHSFPGGSCYCLVCPRPVCPTLFRRLFGRYTDVLFSFLVETLQYFDLIKVLGLENSGFAKTVLGSSFEWPDIVAYTAGITVILLIENRRKQSHPKTVKNNSKQ